MGINLLVLTGFTGVLKIRLETAFKRTCSDKRAEELDSSVVFPVTDEKRFVLDWLNERSGSYL